MLVYSAIKLMPLCCLIVLQSLHDAIQCSALGCGCMVVNYKGIPLRSKKERKKEMQTDRKKAARKKDGKKERKNAYS